MTRKPKASKEAQVASVRSGTATFSDSIAFADLFGKGYNGNARMDLFRLAVSLICIDVKSQDASKTPIYLYERVPGGQRIVEPGKHPVAKMLATRPNRYLGIREWVRIAAAHLVTANQYYAAVQRTKAGDVLQMQGIPHTKINRRVNMDARQYVYDVMPGTSHEIIQWGWARDKRGLIDSEIAHIRLRSMNGFDTLGNDLVGSAAFNLVSSMADYQSGVYANGGVGALAFRFPAAMTDVQFARLNKDLSKASQDAQKMGKPIILEGANGVMPDVEKLSVTATDNEFMKAQTQAMLDVLRVYRVPPHKAFVFESVKYDNLESMERLYVEDSLVPIFIALEEALTPVLLTESEQDKYFIAFDREAAYAMDPTARQKITESLWKNGMITKNEMRERIGENKADDADGDVFMLSGNFVLINSKNEPVLQSGGNAPGQDPASDTSTDPAADPATEPKKHLRVV